MNVTRELLTKLKKIDLRQFLFDKYDTRFVTINETTSNARCPHPDHDDRNPSFSVWHDKEDNWYWCCHSCHCDSKNVKKKNYGTDIIALIQWLSDYKGSTHILSFQEAVKIAARYAGIVIEDDKKTNPQYYTINKAYEKNLSLAQIWNNSLINYPNKAKDYLINQRKLNMDDIREWKLGFNGSRIVFPLFNRSRKILGFSNRIIEDNGEAKYINSPNSKVFNKSKYLYGIDHVDSTLNYIIITEGQMDVIAANKFGLKNVVATLGTAFTHDHATYLIENFKKIESIIFAFDGDKAGKKALVKAAEIAMKYGFSVNYVLLPENQDLYDFMLEYKEEAEKKFFSLYFPYYYKEFEEDIKEYDQFMTNFNNKVISKGRTLYAKYKNPKEKELMSLFIKNRFNLNILNNDKDDKIYVS